MMSEWRVSTQYFGEEQVWQVYRLRKAGAVDHSGNREYAEGVFETRQAAEELAARLNAGE